MDATAASDTTRVASGSMAQPPAKRARSDRLLDQFAEFRDELNAHHDSRERLIKLSRDITALSKKLIFALHRITVGDRTAVFKGAPRMFPSRSDRQDARSRRLHLDNVECDD